MEPKDIVRFLKQKKKGIYRVIAKQYAEVISENGIGLAIELIQTELSEMNDEVIKLDYQSLHKATSRLQTTGKECSTGSHKRKYEFKDSFETDDRSSGPGRFD